MSAFPVTTDTVLQLLRQLPPREQLRVLAQVLPELERDLPAALSAPDFWCGVDATSLVSLQGVRPVNDFDAILGGWPEDESVDDFIATIRDWRQSDLVELDAE